MLIRDSFAMITDLRRNAPGIGHWGAALNIPHVVGGLIFIQQLEALLVLVTCVVSVMVAAQIHKRAPYSRLTSIVHVVWLPLFPYLVMVLMARPEVDIYGAWLAYVAVTMGISLVLDARNLVLYATSRDRQFEGTAS